MKEILPVPETQLDTETVEIHGEDPELTPKISRIRLKKIKLACNPTSQSESETEETNPRSKMMSKNRGKISQSGATTKISRSAQSRLELQNEIKTVAETQTGNIGIEEEEEAGVQVPKNKGKRPVKSMESGQEQKTLTVAPAPSKSIPKTKVKKLNRSSLQGLEPEPEAQLEVDEDILLDEDQHRDDEEKDAALPPAKKQYSTTNLPKKTITSKRVPKTPGKPRTKTVMRITSPVSEDSHHVFATKQVQRVVREKPPVREVSVDDEGKRRSNRSRIAPLAFWKNERMTYVLDRSEVGKGGVAMPKLAEVVRVESDDEIQTKARKIPYKRKRDAAVKGDAGLRHLREGDGIEEAGDTEVWENTALTRGATKGELGVKIGPVKSFPPHGDESEEAELAYSKFRINAVSTASNDFKFVKTFTNNHFGTGVLEIPPGCLKRPKNSGKMNLVFYIISGRATVEVADNDQFRIGAGGQVMIPRGVLNIVLHHGSANKSREFIFFQKRV